LFPLRVRLSIESGDAPETIGWLLLGPRPDGSFFGKDEREAIEHVAGPVARAIHIAQLRERRDEQAERRISALEALVEKIASSTAGAAAAASA
jgi:GAF domain-containing protein